MPNDVHGAGRMPRLLYLVRHAAPLADPRLPPHTWGLSSQGREDAAAIARVTEWTNITTIWSSAEPKARETARIIADAVGAAVRIDEDLGELRFDAGFLPEEEFMERVGSFLDGADDSDFEAYGDALRRITSCISRLGRREGGALAVVSHGRILTVLLGHLLGHPAGSHVWRAMRLPDLAVLDLRQGAVVRPFGER